MACEFGEATTVSFSSGLSGVADQLTQIGGLNRSVAVADVTPLSQARGTYKKKKFGRRYDHEAIEFEYYFDKTFSESILPALGNEITITITFNNESETLSGTGAIVRSSTPTVVGDEVMMCSIAFQFTGGTTNPPTYVPTA